MFLEWDTRVIGADWNLKGEHSPRASCSGWKMGVCVLGRGCDSLSPTKLIRRRCLTLLRCPAPVY